MNPACVVLHRDLPSAPRPVKLRDPYRLSRVILLVLGLGLPIPLVIVMTRSADRLRRIQDEGATTTGTVRGLPNPFMKSRTYHVHYDYTVDGQSLAGSSQISSRRWQSLRIGQTVAISYVPDEPTIQHIAPVTDADITGKMHTMWIVLGFHLLGFGLAFVFCDRQWRRYLRLLRDGHAIEGTVVSYDRRKSQKRPPLLRYRYVNAAGETCSGADRLPVKVGQAPARGAPVIILCDAENPTVAASLPRVLAFVNLDVAPF